MTRYCLDTSAYSNFKRGHKSVTDLIDSAHWIGISSVALGELAVGFLLGSHRDRNEAELRAFLDDYTVEEVVVDAEVSGIYAEMVVALRRAGTPLPTNDVWIAAAAARAEAVVLTYDPHFKSIEGGEALILGSLPSSD